MAASEASHSYRKLHITGAAAEMMWVVPATANLGSVSQAEPQLHLRIAKGCKCLPRYRLPAEVAFQAVVRGVATFAKSTARGFVILVCRLQRVRLQRSE
jgi:hypothetical protein